MDLFYKSRYFELRKIYYQLIETIEKTEIQHTKTIQEKDSFGYTLLSEKSKLEKQNAKLEQQITELEEKMKILESNTRINVADYERKLENLIQENEELSKKNIELKFDNIRKKNTIGGYQCKNNKLIKETGEQQCYINLLVQRLKKYVKKTPTLNDLLEYEHTRKSPYKKIEKEEGILNEKVK